MKKIIRAASLLPFIILILAGCNTGYRTDIHSLISPAALPYLKESKLIQVSSLDPSGGNKDNIVIAPGKKAEILHAEGPGMIVRMWFNVESRDPHFLRRIVIRIFWDKEEKPSVEVPFGDFFGCGFGYSPYSSQYLAMNGGGYVCYFPMPFEQEARIEIANETLHEIFGFYYQIDYHRFEGALESNVAYFHAQWNRSIRTNYDSNYVLLEATGRGHVVGVNLNVQSYDGKFDFMEGEEMFYVDGEKRPSIQGTGTADYFSSGGYFEDGKFDGPFQGLILKDDSLGRISAYRFHSVDPIPFKKHILMTIEHGHGNQVIADYSSTVYWYQMEKHQNFKPFPKAGQRIPLRIAKPVRMLEAENLPFKTQGLRSMVMDMSDYGPDWGNNKQMVIEARENSGFGVDIKSLKEPLYNIDLYYTKGPEYGNADVFINDIKAGSIEGYSPYLLPTGKVTLTNLNPAAGWSAKDSAYRIRFVVTGKHPAAKGYKVGLDGIYLEPKRVYIPEWYVIGPFPNPYRPGQHRRGLDTVYVPEVYVDLKSNFRDSKGKNFGWTYARTPENGFFSLADKIYPNELVVAYAVTYIHSPDARSVILFLGTDDGGKVFCNDKMVFRYYGERIAEPDLDEIELKLNPGWNKLLLKVENNLGQFAFYARLVDTGSKLTVSADKTFDSQ